MLQHYHKTFIMNCTVNDTKSCMWVCGCRDKGNLAVPLAHQKWLSKRIKAVFVNIHFISLPLFLKLFANSTRSVLSPRVKTVWCYSSHASLGNQVGNPQLSSLGTAAIAKERLCWGWGRRFSSRDRHRVGLVRGLSSRLKKAIVPLYLATVRGCHSCWLE